MANLCCGCMKLIASGRLYCQRCREKSVKLSPIVRDLTAPTPPATGTLRPGWTPVPPQEIETMHKLSTTADQLRETLRTLSYMERMQHIRHHEEIAESEHHKAYLLRLKQAPVIRQDKVRIVPGPKGETGWIAIVPLGGTMDINADLESIWDRYNDLAERLRYCGYDAHNTGYAEIRVKGRQPQPVLNRTT